jgi:S-adenosylmethionine decarboxylase
LLDDAAIVCRALRAAAAECGAALLNVIDHKFSPQGVTALALLAESHIAIHTWPDAGYAAIDIFTCGSTIEPEAACRYLIEVLQAGDHRLVTLRRGAQVR